MSQREADGLFLKDTLAIHFLCIGESVNSKPAAPLSMSFVMLELF